MTTRKNHKKPPHVCCLDNYEAVSTNSLFLVIDRFNCIQPSAYTALIIKELNKTAFHQNITLLPKSVMIENDVTTYQQVVEVIKDTTDYQGILITAESLPSDVELAKQISEQVGLPVYSILELVLTVDNIFSDIFNCERHYLNPLLTPRKQN